MPQSFPSDKSSRNFRLLSWLHLLGAVLVVVVTALFSAVHSPLGQEISAGESPGFAWVRANIIPFLGFVLIYLILVCRLQIKQIRQSLLSLRILPLLVCIEVTGIALIALLLFFQWTNFLPLVLSVLLVSLLLQVLITPWRSERIEDDRQSVVSQRYSTSTGLFLFLLFVMGAAVSSLDPSGRRLADQVLLDSNLEYNLRYLYPLLISGVTTVWFGVGLMIILFGFSRVQPIIIVKRGGYRVCNFLTFFSLVATFSAFLFVTLYYAIPWQINNLDLKFTVWQLFIFLSVAGGLLFSSVFYRIASSLSPHRGRSLAGIVTLTFGAAIIFPVAWLLTSGRPKKISWILLLILTFGVCVFIGCVVLFGDIFNPWFTSFSYLKGAILKVIMLVSSGILVLMSEPLFSIRSGMPSRFRRPVIIMALAGVLGFLPFYTLGKFPEVKAAVLQYNELTRVDTTIARELANTLGLGRWIHLGQSPSQNDSPHPWPQPWRLDKTHPSLLPEGFNLLVIVVDALRGDAFHSAGYHRNLTPFLDRWARQEALSFRRAYSQGGGSFAAFPFLVAGRSRFELYGPGLYQQNLYFKIAQAEGIQHYMLVKGFGPRAIYPPDLAVTELAIPRAVSDRRSATADEVFEAARQAILGLPANERFLCFLTLMDVHNDLWKKEGGTDFGDLPRDL